MVKYPQYIRQFSENRRAGRVLRAENEEKLMKRRIALLLAALLLLPAFAAVFALPGAAAAAVYLSDLTPTSVTTGWGEAHYNENLEGGQLSLANAGSKLTFAKGICIHAESSISFDISSFGLPVFTATIGMDDGSYSYKEYAGASFEVWVDGVKQTDYGTKRLNDAAQEIFVTLPAGARTLTLKNGHGDDGSTWSEHCCWCDARLISDPNALASLEARVSSAVLQAGETAQVGCSAYSAGGEEIDTALLGVSYSSSDDSVATVSPAGVVTACGEGGAIITVTAVKDGYTAIGCVSVVCVSPSSQSRFALSSPSGALQILLENGAGGLTYAVYKNGETAVEPSAIGYLTETADFTGGFAYEAKTTAAEIDDVYRNYSGSFAYGEDHCFEQSVVFSKGAYFFTVTMRAYDDGYAVRSSISRRDGGAETLTVTDDKTAVKLPAGTTLRGSQISRPDMMKGASYESGYPTLNIENAAGKYILKAPIASVNGRLWVLLSEAHLYGDPYIGSIFKGIGNNTLEYTAGPQKCTEDGSVTNAQLDAMSSDELDARLAQMEIIDVALSPSFTFPWRYGVVGSLSEIVESDLTDNLNPPASGDFSWVRTGFTAWMWLSEGFGGQRDEQTIREYIDLAASLGWKYLILDEGWQPGSNVAGKAYDGYFDYFDDLLAYAESKGVGFIAWIKLCDLDTPEEREILTEWAIKGIKGIKFDFVESESIDRMVNVKAIYEKCAEVHLLVNEHGGNIPTGERRTYPNVINRESVKGQEYGGVWCTDTTVMPYTRAAVGPTDITPRLEATGSNTASHQLALQIVIESGMPCMASDTEVYYASNAKYILANLPTFWDDLHFVDGYPGDSTVLARRKGGSWYVGGITSPAKTVTFTLDFIDDNAVYTALLYRDGGSRSEILLEKFTARKGDEITVPMLQGGGFSLMLLPEGAYIAPTALDTSKNVLMLEEGSSEQIELAVAPEGVDLREATFVSGDPGVAFVDACGIVTARKAGVALVTVALPSAGLQTSVEVRVYAQRDYTLSNAWTVVNGDASNPVSAGSSEYTIGMPILTGDTTGTPKNLVLTDAPAGDFVLTAKVSGGLSRDYDSVGLIVYGGSGNMVVMTRRYHSYLGGNIFCLSNYSGGYNEKSAPDAARNADAWVKLVKTGDIFTGYYSYDGVNYTQISETISAPQVAGASGLTVGVCGIHGNLGISSLTTATVSDFTLNGETIPFCMPASENVLSVRRSATKQIVPSVLRPEDSFADLSFVIKNENIASVDGSGLLTAREAGVTKMTVVNNKTGETEQWEVQVYTIANEGYGEFVIVNPQSGKMPAVDEDDPYTLTMPTLTGDINKLPKNLVLTGAPTGDFTLTVRVSGGLNKDFQSVGLVVYNGEGSMVTMERRSHSYFGGNVFCASGSTTSQGIYAENRKAESSAAAEAYLKLVKNGNTFTGYYSYNGTAWTALTSLTNAEVGSSADLQVGLIARTGTPQAEMNVTYSDFTVDGARRPFKATEELLQLIAPDDFTLGLGADLPALPAVLRGFYNSGRTEELPVVWDTDGCDASAAGEYILTARHTDSGLTASVTVTVVSLYTRGDLNADGRVSVADVSALLDAIAGAAPLPAGIGGDLDGDGEVSVSDVTALLDLIASQT